MCGKVNIMTQIFAPGLSVENETHIQYFAVYESFWCKNVTNRPKEKICSRRAWLKHKIYRFVRKDLLIQ